MIHTSELESADMVLTYNGTIYRLEETFGYTSTMDCIINMRALAKLLGTSPLDIGVNLTINEKNDFNTNLAEVDDVIHDWLERS
jgi:hypothetical protein